MQRLSLDLGFSPAARARISLDDELGHDELEKYLRPAR
jgi:hypothetical protein